MVGSVLLGFSNLWSEVFDVDFHFYACTRLVNSAALKF